jgi:O-antigen/teichoic acid export membrane protein
LLAPEIFGIYSYAVSLIALTRAIQIFGLNNAYIHHAPESEGETSLRVYFSLSIIFTLIWTMLIYLISFIFVPHENRWVLYILVITEWVDSLTRVARVILIKQIAFRRIAVIELLITIMATFLALVFATSGFGIWSLLITDIIAGLIALVGLYIIKPIWKPMIGWSSNIARYYIKFGFKSFLSDLLSNAHSELDDVWTGRNLGDLALGFYSRAYTFATYPRKILSAPFNQVSAGTYAEVKSDPMRLSQAFFRFNALLIRIGFFAAGLLALIAPELIRLLLGVKWLPMLPTFRIMLVFTLFDPIRTTISNLFFAVGHPEKTVRTNVIQVITLIICLFVFGKQSGIVGVAIAVDIMLIVGIIYMLILARQYVKFSVRRLFLIPTISISLGLILARAAIEVPGILGSPWRTGIVKSLIFTLVYGIIVFLFEREQIPRFANIFINVWTTKNRIIK